MRHGKGYRGYPFRVTVGRTDKWRVLPKRLVIDVLLLLSVGKCLGKGIREVLVRKVEDFGELVCRLLADGAAKGFFVGTIVEGIEWVR